MVLALLLIAFRGFSQKAIENNGDTLICFTPDECKIILKEINRKDYLDSLNKYNLVIISEYKNIISDQSKMLSAKEDQISLKNSEQDVLNNVVKEKDFEIKKLKKDIRKQKTQKVVAIILGSAATLTVTYFYIVK